MLDVLKRAGRSLYRQLPLTETARAAVDELFFRVLGPVIGDSPRYRRWRVRKALAVYGCGTSTVRNVPSQPDVVVVGHVFSPTGLGEVARSLARALREAGIVFGVTDIHEQLVPDRVLLDEFWAFLVPGAIGRVNVFCINADEVETVCTLMQHAGRVRRDAWSVIVPFWELARFPPEWASLLERFDEVWAPSRFVFDGIAPLATVPVLLVPCAVQAATTEWCHRRRYFGVSEDAYTFLLFFDLTSYLERKNPFAVLAAFERFLEARPGADACLVIKVSGGREHPETMARLRRHVGRLGRHVLLIECVLTSEEMQDLMRCCDCFVSLHRAEGFGRGPAEAMSLGKPVIATAYSGNMDYMTPENSLLVNYRLVPVEEGAYPFAAGQVWAEADVAQAASFMIRLYDDPMAGRAIGARARDSILLTHGYRSVGAACKSRIRQIIGEPAPDAGRDAG